MHKLVFAPLANADLTDIGDYLAHELHNPQAAVRLIQKIKKSVYMLEQFPDAGTALDVEKGRMPYRYLLCENYMIFYHLDDANVKIDRVLYGRRDYLAILYDEQAEDVTEADEQTTGCVAVPSRPGRSRHTACGL